MNNQNDRDLYTIPPNFIGSSTFLGGMFKVRNVIEAGILAVAIGVPVMFLLPYSLMTRIIILCLTALPAAMIGLMGISGESLSSFIVIFFRYLRNRRTLGGETAKSRKRTKRQKVPGKEKRKKKQPKKKAVKRKQKTGKYERPAPEKPQKQERDKKPPKQEKPDTPAFLNPVAEYFPVAKIENGIIYTKDHRYVKIVEVIPINFLLRSTREQRNIIYSFVSYLKISPIRVQFKVLTRRADINQHMETVRREMEVETNEQCRLMQEDYLQFVQQISSREAVTRRFFLIFEHEPWSNSRKDEESDAITSLQTAVHTASNYLRQCGNKVIIPDNEDEFTVDVLYNLLCRNESAVTPLPSKVKEVAAQRFLANMDFEEIPAADFFSPKEIDFTHARYIRIDGLYYAYLLVPSDGYRSTVPAGWLSLIVNAGDGVDMDMFLFRQSKERIVQTVGQQLRINRSKIKDASDTNTDFDDIDSAIKAGYYLKEGLANNLVSPENSDSWSCLAEVEGQELMAQLFVDVIIKNTSGGKGDHFWDSAEMNLLKALVLYVDQSYPPETKNMGQVYQLLTLQSEKELNSLFDVLPNTHPAKAPYTLFKQSSETVRSGVIIGLGSRLQVFQAELIKKITARDEIDLELPGQKPCAYFLVTSDQDGTFDFLDYVDLVCGQYGGKAGEVFMVGDSAGAFLILYTAAIQRNRKLASVMKVTPAKLPIEKIALISGMFYTTKLDSIGLFLSESLYGKDYRKAPFYPYLDPGNIEVCNSIPPAMFFTSRNDNLRRYTRRLANVLASQNLPYILRDYGSNPSLTHAFPVFSPGLMQSKQATEEIGNFFKGKYNILLNGM